MAYQLHERDLGRRFAQRAKKVLLQQYTIVPKLVSVLVLGLVLGLVLVLLLVLLLLLLFSFF